MNNVKGVLIFGYLSMAVIFLLFSVDSYSNASRLMAWSVFLAGTFPIISYFVNNYTHFPIIETVVLAYANAFSFPVLFQEKHSILVKDLSPDSEPVSLTLFFVLIAIFSLWFGFKAAPGVWASIRLPQMKLSCDPIKLYYYGVILCVLSLVSTGVRFGVFQGLLNIIVAPGLGVAILALLYYKGLLSTNKKIIALSLVGISVANGIAIGMTEAIVAPLLVWYLARWLVTGKVEISAILVGICILVLLQPVKLQYRNIVWTQQVEIETIDKVKLFSNIFYEYWIVSDEGEKIVDSTYSRSSLLLQTAHVIDWTPNVVDYKKGSTLSFMFVNLIPRFLWPNKPIAQQANIDYAVQYGVTTEEGVKSTMFGVGHLGEVYMNFGGWGVLPIYILIGVLIYLPLYLLNVPVNIIALFRNDYSIEYLGSMSLMLVVLMKFMMVGSTVGDTFGGFFQLIIVQVSIMHFFTKNTDY